MSNASDYLESALGDHILRAVALPSFASQYVALFTTAPDEAGAGGVEVTGGSYARVSYAPGAGAWAEGAAGVFTNTGLITYPQPTANWGDVVAWALMDAPTGGNILILKTLPAPVSILNGQLAPEWPIGALTISFT